MTLVSGSAVIADLKGEVMLQSAQGAALPAQRGQVLPAESSIETSEGESPAEPAGWIAGAGQAT